MPVPDLIAERFTLRAPRPADAKFYALATSDDEIQSWCPGVPQGGYSPVGVLEHFEALSRQYSRGERYAWLIDASGLIAGQVSLKILSPTVGEIGVWTAPAARGRGLTSEALLVPMGFAFDPQGLGLGQLRWTAFAGNSASMRLAQRLGFSDFEFVAAGVPGREQGSMLDCYTATLKREEWAFFE